jgi:flavin reductase (DIM6/NTAB) family NADH-FMN oxidoreductase RutF
MNTAVQSVARTEMDQRLLRSALGSFATGVIIVSATYDGRDHAMTANSFTSVSLTPPLVLICTHNNARMTRLLERGMEFGLSVLAAGQEDISRRFAVGGGEPAVDFSWFRGVPLIAGAAAHFVCRLTDSRVTGDHTVQIAEVEYFQSCSKAPLVFWNGAYSHLTRSEQ